MKQHKWKYDNYALFNELNCIESSFVDILSWGAVFCILDTCCVCQFKKYFFFAEKGTILFTFTFIF